MPSSTFNVAVSGDDGYAGANSATWPPAAGDSSSTTGTVIAPERGLVDTTFILQVALVRWDTSSLPDDATIDSATLRLRVTAKADPDSRSLTAEWYEAGTIDTGDWTSTVGTDAHAGTTIAAITTGADNDFALINVSNVNRTGYTGLRLHISGGQPTGENYILFASFDHATLTEPRLIVNYTEAGGANVPRSTQFHQLLAH